MDSDDDFSYDLSNAIYGGFPPGATAMSPRTWPASSPHAAAKTSHEQKATSPIELNFYRPKISLDRTNATLTWLPRHHDPREQQLGRACEMATVHQSVLLHLTAGSENNTESELWMLPELDDWEAESDDDHEEASSLSSLPHSSSPLSSLQHSSSPSPPTQQHTGQQAFCTGRERSTLFHRAAKSNLERLRARLEAEGWDFAGARFTDQINRVQQQAPCQSEDRLDEEFDVVVLSAVRVGC